MPNDTAPSLPKPLLVACLCAQWCATCREYRAVFEDLASHAPATQRFIWIDIEDEAELVDPVEVENFPTVLIARGSTPLFHGPITPQRDTLARLVQLHAAESDGPAPSLPQGDELRSLAQRILSFTNH